MIYLKLFWAFIQVGLFGFGGGYATIALIQEKVVNDYAWISLTEFGDLVSISQMTPGPIVINTATFVGTKIAGPMGAVAATLGSILPSIIIVSIIALVYKKYSNKNIIQSTLTSIHPVVVGLIASAAYSLLLICVNNSGDLLPASKPDYLAIIMITVSFAILRKFKPNPMLVMALTALSGLLYGVF